MVNSIHLTPSTQQLSQTNRVLESAYEKLATGRRINSASDDAAGNAVATRISAAIQSLDRAGRNASDGISLAQVTEAALNSIGDNVQRIRELSIQANNGALNDNDRASIQAEVESLKSEVNRIVETSEFNGKSLLTSSQTLDFQIGSEAGQSVSLSTNNIQSQLVDSGFNDIDVSTAEGAETALGSLDSVLSFSSSERSNLGSIQNRLESTFNTIQSRKASMAESSSRIVDTDYAKESSNMVSNQIKRDVNIAILSQANMNRGTMLSLLV